MQAEFCTLCFTPGDGPFEPIEEDARESLILLFSHLVAKTRRDSHVACADCLTRLRGYLEFKSSFMQTQACVQSLGTEHSGGLLGHEQAYLQNDGNGGEVSGKNLVVCHFCLKQATGAYTILVEDSKELSAVTLMMHKCFPGLELGTLSRHTICVPCHKALEASYDFIRSLDVENRIKEEEEMEFEEAPDLKPMLLESEMLPNGNSCVDLNTVKKEDSFTSNGDDFDGAVEAKVEVEQVDEQELDEKHKVKFEAAEDVDVKEHSLSSFDDAACDFKAEQITIENVSVKTLGTKSETTCKSENSFYKMRRNPNLKYQELTEPPMHKCPPSKGNYNHHVQIHKKRTKVTMHKCAKCSYETKRKHDLMIHMLIHHETIKEDMIPRRKLNMYECKVCTFKTRHKNSLKTHMLIHKKSSEVTIHKCEECSYETRHQSYLTTHMLIHKEPSEVTIHKCEECSYETRRKRSLKLPMLIHKKPSEVPIHKCAECSYETIHKNSLNRHMLIHKKPSEVTIHKCAECSYETRLKGSLKTHMFIHKKRSEVTIHKCAECSYETKHKGNLKVHMVIHKALSEVTILKCEKCSYESRYKCSLKTHMLIHKKPSETTSYKCI